MIMAVACDRDLTSGIQYAHRIPTLGILNRRPHGPCLNTDIYLEELEQALSEKSALEGKMTSLEEQVARYKQIERAMNEALVVAQKVADEKKDLARREAELILREAREETSLSVQLQEQFHAYSDPARDPRHHTVSTVFIATASGEPIADDDAKHAAVFTEENLPNPIVFDHEKILTDYFLYRHGIPKNQVFDLSHH